MEIVLLLLLVLIVVVLYLAAKRKPHTSRGAARTKRSGVVEENIGWLKERWDAAQEEQESGELKTIPPWFFDDVTHAQLKRIAQLGVEITKGNPTKGEASDIIGLFEPPDEYDAEILKFFNVPLVGMNQSNANHTVMKLFQDEKNVDAWNAKLEADKAST